MASSNAFQLMTPKGVVDTFAPVNTVTGLQGLQQDMIDNVSTNQTNRAFGHVFGRNNVVNNTRCDLWEGPTCVYVFPVTPQRMSIVSTSADDAIAGTGIQKVIVRYLDDAYIARTEIVSLNGLTPTLTVATNVFRINAVHAIQSGNGAAGAHGVITIKNLAGTVTYSQISTTFNSARQAIYTVQAGVTGYISHWQSSSGTTTGTHFTTTLLVATTRNGVLYPGVFLVVDEVGTLNGSSAITLPIPIRIPATADVKLSAISDAANANANVMGAIMGWFENN